MSTRRQVAASPQIVKREHELHNAGLTEYGDRQEVTLRWERNAIRYGLATPQIELNWSACGSVSIERAEQFVAALEAAIADAKAKRGEMLADPTCRKCKGLGFDYRSQPCACTEKEAQ